MYYYLVPELFIEHRYWIHCGDKELSSLVGEYYLPISKLTAETLCGLHGTELPTEGNYCQLK